MKNDESIWLIVLLGIIALAAFGGFKNSSITNKPLTPAQNEVNVEQKIRETQIQVDELKKQLQIEEDKKTQSKYFSKIKLQYINRSDKPGYEYITLYVDQNLKEPVSITGWKIRSLSSGNTASIPFGTQLYFTGTVNTEDAIILYPGDTVYVSTGISPNGSSFRVNKCSGYLSQFQTFIPYLSTYCPQPRNEDLSSIPNRVINDACFDYINSMSSCRIQTDPLPKNWSYECTNFIINKINYPSCVTAHKNDNDFYQKEWRIFLKRSDVLWKSNRENVVLYDNEDKIVDSLKY